MLVRRKRAAPPCGAHPVMYLFRQHMTRRRGLHIVRDDFFTKVISHAFRRSSSPNRTRCTGLRFGFGCKPESSGIYSVAMLQNHIIQTFISAELALREQFV